MWSIFSRYPAKDFPYEIGDLVEGLNNNSSIWQLHKAKRKVIYLVVFYLFVYIIMFIIV